jgi:xanthosine utilization system XapX-like protein
VRSPAPPLVALVGLLGILIGEQIPPRLHLFGAEKAAGIAAWIAAESAPADTTAAKPSQRQP